MDKINSKLNKYRNKLINSTDSEKMEMYNLKMQQYMIMQKKLIKKGGNIFAVNSLNKMTDNTISRINSSQNVYSSEAVDKYLSDVLANVKNAASILSDISEDNSKLTEQIIRTHRDAIKRVVSKDFNGSTEFAEAANALKPTENALVKYYLNEIKSVSGLTDNDDKVKQIVSELSLFDKEILNEVAKLLGDNVPQETIKKVLCTDCKETKPSQETQNAPGDDILTDTAAPGAGDKLQLALSKATAPVENPFVAKEEPVVAKEEPVVAKEDPVIVKEEPVVAKEDPVIVKEEPVVAKEEPVVAKEEPVVAKEEPVVAKEESVKEVTHKVIQDGEVLPEGWVKQADKDNYVYYTNSKENKTQWQHPVSPVLKEGWTEIHDPSENKSYFYNAETKLSQWDRPESQTGGFIKFFQSQNPPPSAPNVVRPTLPPPANQAGGYRLVRNRKILQEKERIEKLKKIFRHGNIEIISSTEYDI